MSDVLSSVVATSKPDISRAYRYILIHNSGMAPCPDGGLISLATCKPVICRVARSGDWVLGFRPGSLERGLMLWAGKVAETMGCQPQPRRTGQTTRWARVMPIVLTRDRLYRPRKKPVHTESSASLRASMRPPELKPAQSA